MAKKSWFTQLKRFFNPDTRSKQEKVSSKQEKVSKQVIWIVRKERVVVSHLISPEVIRFGEKQDKPIKTHLFSLFLINFHHFSSLSFIQI